MNSEPSDLNPSVDAPARGRVSATASVSLSEVLSALSHALDLTDGQVPGHTICSASI